MKENYNRKKLNIIICMICMMCNLIFAEQFMFYCNATEDDSSSQIEQTSLIGAYDSFDTAIIKNIDLENKKITFFSIEAGKSYTLQYSGTTYIYDRYENGLSASQLKQGQIVDITFLKSNRQINTIYMSKETWEYKEIDKYSLGGSNRSAQIGSATFQISKDVQVFSQGKNVDIMDIIKGDIITVYGINHTIYSINVENGHGYIRLTNDQGLIGGWIEIGNQLITQVSSENMLFAVPEGSYQIKMYHNQSEMTEQVIVERNQEVILDCSDIILPESKTGYVKFEISPETADLSIDGEVKDASVLQPMSYGIHHIEISEEGYETLSKYISVGSEVAQINISLERETVEEENTDDETEDSTSEEISADSLNNENKKLESETVDESLLNTDISGNSVSQNQTNVTASTNKKVYIDSPEDVEVYLDGGYVGLAPVSFTKKAGSHTISLRKDGYESRSFTIYLYDDGEDITYSFSDLKQINNSNVASDISGNEAIQTISTKEELDKEAEAGVNEETETKAEEKENEETKTKAEEEVNEETETKAEEEVNEETETEIDETKVSKIQENP